ncbi:MAG: glycerate kinase [Pseudomonadota bacterium]
MNILVACDKFRGSLTASEANSAVVKGLLGSGLAPNASAQVVPLADGGEGTLDALSSQNSEIVRSAARNAFGEPGEAHWLFDRARGRAVIEMAAVAGHACAEKRGYDPDRATSAGVGDLVLAAAQMGAQEIIVALGGSITVDGGAGALEAAGARYLDAGGSLMKAATGRQLADVAEVDLSQLPGSLDGISITVAADVDNVLAGHRGAAAVFGPQKGVPPGHIDAFDAALSAFDAALARAMDRAPVGEQPFSGAAGGMLVGLNAIARTIARDGFALVAEHHDLAEKVAASDLVVSGEGSLDGQSLSGKGPVGMARIARDAGVPAIAFAGRLAATPQELRENGIAAAFSISSGPMELAAALKGAGPALERASLDAFNAIAMGRGLAILAEG